MDELVIENINIILTKCKSKISIIISNSRTVDYYILNTLMENSKARKKCNSHSKKKRKKCNSHSKKRRKKKEEEM
jgi:hypothetical protein